MATGESRVLLQKPELRLEGSTLVFPEWRFDLDNIEAVELQRIPTAATGPILMLATGFVCLLSLLGEGDAIRAVLGIGLIIAALVWWFQKKPSFNVCLRISGSETMAFESPDEEQGSKVLAAVQAVMSEQKGLGDNEPAR